MKQFEQIQTERPKRPSKIDIATQGEDVNPMAPSSHNVSDGSSRTRQGGSDKAAIPQTHGQPTLAWSPPLPPEFFQAMPSQQFRFRVPDTALQVESNTRAPSCTQFRGVSSQPSSRGSGPPSSQGTSLFSSGSLGTSLTAATSREPSICPSIGEPRLDKQCDPSSQRAQAPTSCILATDDLLQSSQFENSQHDASSFSNLARLQQTISYYGLPLSMNRSGHSLSAAPNLHDRQVSFASHDILVYCANLFPPLEIDEVSPSEDDRIAEEALYGRQGRPSPSPGMVSSI